MSKISTQISVIAATLLVSGNAIAQEKIKDGTVTGTTNQANTSAILDLESNNKGLLLPRVNLTTTTTWGLNGTAPNTGGMTVYNTNTGITSSNASFPAAGAGVYTWSGTGWVASKNVEPWNISSSTNGASANTQNIYQRGNVGIGDFSSSTPATALHIKGTGAADDNITMESRSDDNGLDAVLMFTKKTASGADPVPPASGQQYLGSVNFKSGSTNNARIRVAIDPAVGTTEPHPVSMRFHTNQVDADGPERMRIAGNGNVGIGNFSTTANAPFLSHKLNVDGSVRAERLTSGHNNSGSNFQAYTLDNSPFGLYNLNIDSSTNFVNRIADRANTNSKGSDFNFFIDATPSNDMKGETPYVTIKGKSARVGIGRPDPQAMLHVEGSGGAFAGAPAAQRGEIIIAGNTYTNVNSNDELDLTPRLTINRSRGLNTSIREAVQLGDYIGRIDFQGLGNGGVGFQRNASIMSKVVSLEPSSTPGTNITRQDLSFYVGNGNNDLREKLRLDPRGFSATNSGVYLNELTAGTGTRPLYVNNDGQIITKGDQGITNKNGNHTVSTSDVLIFIGANMNLTFPINSDFATGHIVTVMTGGTSFTANLSGVNRSRDGGAVTTFTGAHRVRQYMFLSTTAGWAEL